MAKKNVLTALALAVSLTAAAPAMTGCVGSTTTNSSTTDRTQIMLISEQEINTSAAQEYDKVIAQAKAQKALNTNAKQTKRVKNIANKLIAKASIYRPDSKKWDWEVNVINSDEVNAWCMPGGKIAVYTGLINTVKPTDDELAVVISHEVAHALREHSREQMSAEYAKQGALNIAAMFGVDQTKLAIGDAISNIGFSLPFSRSHETEADELGLELMNAAGYDTDAAASLWKKMMASSGGSSNALENLLSTHPSNDDRIENLTELSAKLKTGKSDKQSIFLLKTLKKALLTLNKAFFHGILL